MRKIVILATLAAVLLPAIADAGPIRRILSRLRGGGQSHGGHGFLFRGHGGGGCSTCR